MALHLGIVGGSAEGAALCYRTICQEGAGHFGAHGNPEVSMHTPSLAGYVACLERGDLVGVGELMLDSARKLTRIGAQLLICPDNTFHQAYDWVTERIDTPWLHIADCVVEQARAGGHRLLGLLGTTWLVESDVYPTKLAGQGLDLVRPNADDRREVGRIIMEELVPGHVREPSIRFLLETIERLYQAGCDAVILGCTELPLVIDDGNACLPTLDSTRLLARAALRRAARDAA